VADLAYPTLRRALTAVTSGRAREWALLPAAEVAELLAERDRLVGHRRVRRPRATRPPATTGDVAAWIREYTTGDTVTVIARRAGRSESTVYRRLVAEGVAMRGRGRPAGGGRRG
jgi:hypothetical protein